MILDADGLPVRSIPDGASVIAVDPITQTMVIGLLLILAIEVCIYLYNFWG